MVELVKPEFIVGSEKKFFDFISNLNDKDKIALVSHTDLDGIASAKVVNEVVKAEFLYFKPYHELNDDLIKDLKAKKAKKVIFTDLILPLEFVRKIEKDFDVLIIDHHIVQQDYNSEKVSYLASDGGYCATYLSYYLFSKIENLEKFDWLVVSACVADFCFRKNRKWVDSVYEKYGDKIVEEGNYVKKEGKVWKIVENLNLALIYLKDELIRVYEDIGIKFGEIGGLGKYADEVKEYVESCVKDFEKEKKEINGRYLWEFKPKFSVASMVSTLISLKITDKTVIIAREEGEDYCLSVRRQDGGENVEFLLRRLVEGLKDAEAGGHFKAAGGHFNIISKNEFLERLGKIKFI